MRLELDVTDHGVTFDAARSIYSKEAIKIAAQIWARRAEVFLQEGAKIFEITLKAKKKIEGEAELKAMAGEFLNELLNQEYRFLVGGFNRKISNRIVAQALLCARGEEKRPALAPEEKTPEFKAEVARLLKQAQAEIARTMPKKLPPQGAPLPPAQEDAGV